MYWHSSIVESNSGVHVEPPYLTKQGKPIKHRKLIWFSCEGHTIHQCMSVRSSIHIIVSSYMRTHKGLKRVTHVQGS